MSENTPLFTPFIHKKIELPNRIVMAPMTRNQAPGGQVNQKMIDYYVRRAEGGVGFIIKPRWRACQWLLLQDIKFYKSRFTNRS